MLEPLPAASANFSAVLLAGGHSSRMGRDKAGVMFGGQPLWQRQLATLRATSPSALFISGRLDGPYAEAGVPILCDAAPGLGPLAGISAALRHTRHPHLLVLAIDLPMMTAPFLSELVAQGPVVPQANDWFEPLAAVYPRSCLSLAEECLRNPDRSMQRFVRLAIRQGLLKIRDLAPGEIPLFRNVNTPADC